MVRPKKVISGEIFKEPLLDVFLTDLEQISFSLFSPKRSSITKGLREHEHSDSTESECSANKSYAKVRKPSGANQRFASKRSAFVSSKEKQSLHLPPGIYNLRSVRSSEKMAERRTVGPLLGLHSEAVQPRRTQPTAEHRPHERVSARAEQGLETSQQITLNVKIGDYVHCGDKIGEFFERPPGLTKAQALLFRLGEAEQRGVAFEDLQAKPYKSEAFVRAQKQSFCEAANSIPVIIGDSGRVITLTKTKLTLQKTQPVLFYSEATSHVRENEWVQRGSPILTLTHQTLVTGDIVQGIPRIEQLFEAVTSSSSALPDDEPLYETLHSQAREIFRRNWSKAPLPTAVRQALEEIQQIIVESIQKVYLSQGVLIADKHIEIIVKQMTSKGQIIDNGNTGFIINEVLPLQKIENANLTTSGKRAVYAPAVVGLTRAALNSDSFVSAASFQETTRVLTRDAVAGKTDFLRGLKEKVVIGDLISAGTGLDLFFLYTLLAENIFDPTCEKMSGLKKPPLNKNDSSIRRL
jgi:hypothetical protein